jgi:PEP-CTERM motif
MNIFAKSWRRCKFPSHEYTLEVKNVLVLNSWRNIRMFKKSFTQAMLSLGVTLVFLPVAAYADVVTTTGEVTFVSAPPSDITLGHWQSNTELFAFAEQQGLTLTSPLAVDISVAGTSPTPTSDNFSPTNIPTDTPIDSYMLHSDPVGSPSDSNPVEFTGSITVPGIIIGLITTSPDLIASNSVVGLSGVTYSTGKDTGVTIDPGTPGPGSTIDSVTLSADLHTVTVDFYTGSSVDDMRIITAAPEPASLSIAGLGVIALLKRRR